MKQLLLTVLYPLAHLVGYLAEQAEEALYEWDGEDDE